MRHGDGRAGEVLLVEGAGRGFVSQYSHALALLLHRDGVPVRLATSPCCELRDWSMPFARDTCLDGSVRGWLALDRLVAEHHPSVVHFQWMARPWLGLPLMRGWQRRGTAVVFTPHNILPHCARWLSLPFYRALYRSVDGIVARDGHLAWALEEVLEIGRERMAVLPQSPNVVSIDHGRAPRTQAHPPRSRREVRLLVFGHGGRGKGLSLLCDALLSRVWPATLHLLLAGEQVARGVTVDELEAVRAHVRTSVHEGYVPAEEVGALFAGADALVLPYSKICKSPLIDLAADYGVPVIRTDRVHADVFEDGVQGLTVPGGDVRALADALGALAAEPCAVLPGRPAPDTANRPPAALARFVLGHRSLYARIASAAPRRTGASVATALPAGLEG